jgi:hypothetical protein
MLALEMFQVVGVAQRYVLSSVIAGDEWKEGSQKVIEIVKSTAPN